MEEVSSLLEGEVTVVTASRAVVIMVVAVFLVEMSMEAKVISLVEGGYGVIYPVEGGVKVIGKAEGEEAVPLVRIRMFPHEAQWVNFWHLFLKTLFLWSVLEHQRSASDLI